MRIIADECRGKTADYASSLLRFHPSKSATILRKVLESAIANAAENHGVSREELKISTIMVDEGPRLKRITQRSMGRANRIIKKMSHITVILEDFEAKPAIKPHGTKAKPRPTFAAPAKKGKKPAAKAEKAEEVVNEEVVEEVVSEAPVAEAAPVETEVSATVETTEETPTAESTNEEQA